MNAKTPRPPYRFPQQKPTLKSIDKDGEILILRLDKYYAWDTPGRLQCGDLWVPGCEDFFRDWGGQEFRTHAAKVGLEDFCPYSRRTFANMRWQG